MKKVFCGLVALGFLFGMIGCGEAKILHCDRCGKEVRVQASSNMEEDWIVYCEPCNEELFADHPILGAK